MTIIRPEWSSGSLGGVGPEPDTSNATSQSSQPNHDPLPPVSQVQPWTDVRHLPPQAQSWTDTSLPWLPALPNPPEYNRVDYQIPTSVQSALPQYPQQHYYQQYHQTPPLGIITQPEQRLPTFPSESQSSPIARRTTDQEPSLPPSKRRTGQTTKAEVISLLSDDEEGPATTAAPTKKPASTKRKLAPHSDPISSSESLRAAKSQAMSSIKQRSRMPPVSESPGVSEYHFGSTFSTTELPDQTLTLPPSSSLGAGPMPRGRQDTPAFIPDIPISGEPPLCPEQAHLVELIASGQNVFYTGSAGCGKSTVLKAFTKRLRNMGKNVRIIAPTGRAALQVNGSTTWTYAGWTPDHHKRTLDELKEAAHGKFTRMRFRDTDVLVIDEISMVENLHFERLNEIMKEARYKPSLPVQPAFGGVQVVVTGDFCQLPPVKPFQHCIQCGFELAEKNTATGKVHVCKRHGEYRDEDKWAFRSKAWEECNFTHVHLNTIHRQNDETFIRILQKCRIGRQLGPDDTDLLMNHKCMVHHATKLFATREEVANVNRREFERLKTINHTYWCLDEFIWQRDAHPHLGWKGMRKPNGPQTKGPLRALEDHRFDECVQLKKGMLVVLLVNLDLELGLCNGSQGIICGFEQNDPNKLPQAKTAKKDPVNKVFGDRAPMKEEQIKKFIQDPGAKYKTWPIVRFHNGQIRTVYADCSIAELGDERPYSLLVRTQIPLAPAWAMTIHKSQSLTLDRVIVNLSRAFEEGQVYVALSRATGLHGLKIEGDSKGLLAGLGGNPEVQAFLREKFGDMDGVIAGRPS